MAATRLKHHPRYEGLTCWKDGRPTWTGEIRLDRDALKKPLSWKKPRTVFVASMSDLFHEGIPHWFMDDVFSQMFVCDQHTFLVLTKRSERMLRYWKTKSYTPPSNVWLGVTVENEDNLRRVEHLLRTPAAVRFVSMPLLESVDLTDYLRYRFIGQQNVGLSDNWPPLDWVIVEGESGPHAKPMHPDWARKVRDDCQAAGIPFFMKQWGHYLHEGQWNYMKESNGHLPNPCSVLHTGQGRYFGVGKKAAGRLLDGKEYSEWPR